MRVNKTFTVGASPLNIVTESVTPPDANDPTMAVSRLFVQMAAGGAGLGYVLTGVPRGVAGSIANAAHVTAHLGAAADATHPGDSYQETASQGAGSSGLELDARGVWVHGGNAGDKIIVSFDQKV